MSIWDSLAPETLALLIEAGWSSERRVVTKAPEGHPGAAILASCSGLRVGRAGRGETCARSDVDFRLLELDPDDASLHAWAGRLDTSFVGIAEVQNAHGELWVAADGRCFGRSLVHPAFYFEGPDIAQALDRMLMGRRAQPLIPPDAESVTLYGDRYTRDHPDVYDFARAPR